MSCTPEQARAHGLDGDLQFSMVDGPAGSTVSVREQKPRAADEKYLLLDRSSGAVVEQAGWAQFPPLATAVATGVDIHEASYFGGAGPWINTVFALALIWLCLTGALSWWRRKPATSLGVPPVPQLPWPAWLRAAALALFLLLPLLAASALALWLAEMLWARRWMGTPPA